MVRNQFKAQLTHFFKWFVVIGLSFSLLGCGYHLRSWKQWPTTLQTLNYTTTQIPSNVSSLILSFLHSMHISINPNAPYSLTVTKYHFHKSIPSSTNSDIPQTISYYASISFVLENAHGNCSVPFTLNSSFSQLEPSSTLIVQSTDPDLQERLLQDILQQLFEKLTAVNTVNTLTQCHMSH